MDELIRASIKIGIDENWSKDHTYAYNGGFITYRYGSTLYVIKESTAVTKILEFNGFTKNENAFGHMINDEDYARYLEKEGYEGENTRKLDAFLHDREFRQDWESLTNKEDLELWLDELLHHSPYFRKIEEQTRNKR